MVPNNQLLPKAKTKRKSNGNVFRCSAAANRLIISSCIKTLTHAVKEEVIVGLIKKKREIWKRGSGRNLHQSLLKEFKTHDIKMGRDKFFDLLRNNHLLIKSKRCRTKTTCSYHHFNRYKNLIESATPLRSNEIWVSDITYLWLKPQDKFCYLSVITDLYSRKVVGYCVHESLSVKGCIDALKQAIKSRKDKTLAIDSPQ